MNFAITSLKNKTFSFLTAAAAGAALLALAALPVPVHASTSPFTVMAGSWAGSGIITMASGNRERIRCRANYAVDRGGANLDLRLRCASDSYNFELQSNVAYNNGALSGTWAELTRHVGGNIQGSARGNHISARVSGVISALLGMSTNANQQSISIEAPGTEMASVAISLSRGK
jgi:hypothetical protein